MLDPERRHAHTVFLDHDDGFSVGGLRERTRSQAGTGRRHDLGPMMRSPVDRIQPIGLVEPTRDLGDPLRPDDGQGQRMTAAGPAQHRELAEAVDMVRVEMRQQHALDAPRLDADPRQPPRRTRAGIDEIDVLARDHDRAGSRALRIG